MKKYLGRVRGGLLIGSFIFLAAFPAISNEIEWAEVPGTRETDPEFGNSSTFIGTNTITRRGDAINFDLFFDSTFHYARVSGNCRTRWLVSTASGYYTNDGQLVIDNRVQEPLDPDYDAPRLALEFACSQ